ncbi:hypothetical protein [uncultured Campylobacter sp.]|uniref:hypothetical protein n=1 Tax=uncultured Campylobacter sp. TaxID=218934 RepID=UPI00261EC6FE|nr:hypothetical protein [uncultured Campylobacter sp.]
MKYIFCIMVALLFCGCGQKYREILLVPDSKKIGIKSFYVVKNPSDQSGISGMIERSISRQGFNITSDQKSADLVVTYDVIHLSYGVLYIFFRDAKDNFPMVICNDIRYGSEAINRELAVQEIIEAMLKKEGI